MVKRTLAVLFMTLALVLPAMQVLAVDVIDCPVPEATLCESNIPQPDNDNDIFGPDGIITKAVAILSYVVGVAAVIMVIVGGFKYITSSGDSNNINSAKNTILYALIGLVVAVMARTIIVYVVSKL